jgi:hypothetical protein
MLAMPHVVLFGDSIFDNGAYTAGGPDVITQLRGELPPGWKASLLALDGATTRDIATQVRRLPADASHLVVSMGGNDALFHAGLLNTAVNSSAVALHLLAEAVQGFAASYRAALEALRRPGLPLTLCTIYNGHFDDASYQRIASTALTPFNDVIIRMGLLHGLDVIELRLVCTDPRDYANPIEPSSRGGAKIAISIRQVLLGERPLQAARLVAL